MSSGDLTGLDWQTKINVMVRYPSSIINSSGDNVNLIGVEDVTMEDETPVDFVSFINEYNAATIDRIPTYGGSLRVPETSDSVVELRKIMQNRQYFDIIIAQADQKEGVDRQNWKPLQEVYIGCRFISARTTITPGELPRREFRFKARYRNYMVGTSLSNNNLGNGWAVHSGEF